MTRLSSAAVLALLATAAHAQTAATVPVPPGDDKTTVLRLAESAQRTLRQDRLTVQLRAEVTGPDAARVQAEINRRMTAALERAKAVPSVHAESRGYWVQQERPQNAPPRWHGVQTVALTGADFAALLNLAGELQQAGLVMSGLEYRLAPETARASEDELTAEALTRVRARADRIAAAMGLAVRNFRTLQVGNVNDVNPPHPFMLARGGAAAANAPPPAAEPGEMTVHVNIEAEVVLAPPGRP